MRRLCLLALCLVASILAAEAQPSVTTIFQQTWPVLKTNSGAASPVYKEFVPWGVAARDADYPIVGIVEAVKFVSSGGRNVATLDAGSGEQFISGAIALDRIGSLLGAGRTPYWYDMNGPRVVYADYKLTTAWWDEGGFGLPFQLMYGINGFPIVTRVNSEILEIEAQSWNGIGNDPFNSNWTYDTFSFPRATWENKRVRFRAVLTPGTMDAPGNNVSSDGSIRLSVINLDTNAETVAYDVTGLDFYYTWIGRNVGGGSSSPGNNYLSGAALGYFGLIGENEQFVISTLDAAVAVVPAPIPVATTKAPITPCLPNGGTSNGGRGVFGLNAGGIGWGAWR